MDYFELLTHRRSVRKFTDHPVDDTALEQILLAANAAPVGSNLYGDVHLTVVRDPAVLDRLAEAARHRMQDRATMRKITEAIQDDEAVKRTPDPFYGAPAVIFVSHRKQELQPGIEYANAAGIVTAMHLAATALGLGSVYIWGVLEAMRVYPQFDHTDLLQLPEGFEPLLGLAIGHAAVQTLPRPLTDAKITRNDLLPTEGGSL